MYINCKALPDYMMTAGETKRLTIPVYNGVDRQVDMTAMTARFAIADPVHDDSEPFIVRDCSVIYADGYEYAVLQVELDEADTIGLCGQYIYQITVKDNNGRVGVMKGVLTVSANYDKGAISM